MGQMMNLFYDFDKASVYDIHEVNSSFASGSLKVLYLGDNRNGSHFTRDAVERALPSLKNVPIVCHWDYDAGEIGGHDVDIVSTDDGGFRFRNLTEPCGVVPEHAIFRFSTETDDDGNEHEYLIIDNVLLWKRQDVYNHIVNDLNGKVKHSMEINVIKGATDGRGYYNISDFEFTALCLLEAVDPCFQGSELEVFSAVDFKKKMEQMMAELKECYSLINSSSEVSDIQTNESLTEGGEKTLENDIEMNVEAVEESVENSTEQFSEAITGITAEEETAENNTDPENDCSDNETEFALVGNFVDEMARMIRGIEKLETPWGIDDRYWYRDCDLEKHEVYCIDTKDWLLYGFSYSVNGDAITIDTNSKKRMKFVIVEFDGGAEQASPIAEVFAKIQAKFEEMANWESLYNEANARMADMTSELTELREYKSASEEAKEKAMREEILDRFSDLSGIVEFDELCEHSADYNIEVLEEKCYAIRGRNMANVSFSLDNAAPKLVIDKKNNNSDADSDPYHGIVAKFAVQKN